MPRVSLKVNASVKILLINKYHFLKGGAERAYFDMARMLEARGHTVAFFSMRHPQNKSTPWERYFIENIEYHEEEQEGVRSAWKRLRLAGKILFNFDAKRKLESLLVDFQPDIAHLHNIYHQLSPSLLQALKKHRVPVVMTLHDYKLVSPNYNLFVRGKIWEHTSGVRCVFDRCVKDSLVKSGVCAAEKWLHGLWRIYDQVDRFIAPSRFLKEKYHELGFRRNIFFLPNPLLPLASRASPIAPEPRTFLFFGRLSSEKGVDTALEALARLGPETRLWIAGAGPERLALEALGCTLKLGERVHFFGALEKEALEELKGRAWAVLMPSRWYENLPYALTESLQSGCLVIASDLGGITERIQHGENGFLVPPGDPQALARTMETVGSLSTSALASMRLAAQASVGDLGEEAFIEGLLAVYREAMARKEREAA